MNRPPWSLIAFSVLALQPFAVVALRGDLNVEIAVIGLGVVGLLVLLWRASRVAWWVFVVFWVSVVGASVVDFYRWWALALNVIALMLLLAPPTRRHVFRSGRLAGRAAPLPGPRRSAAR